MKMNPFPAMKILFRHVSIRSKQLMLAIKENFFYAIILLVVSSNAYSLEDAAIQTIKSDPMSASYLMQLVAGLFVVVLCIVALAWMAKKMNRLQSFAGDSLKIISGISMGSRERVVLLQVGDQQLLIGVSPGRINTLHVLDKPIDNTSDKTASSIGGNFSDKLKSMMTDAGTAAVKNKGKQ